MFRKMTLKRDLGAAAALGLVLGSPALAQVASPIGQEADQPGQSGPAGPAGQATQAGPATPAEQAPGASSDGADQNGVADIVVTAERRTSSVQRTSASVSVRTGDELRKEGKFQLRDIIENVPGLAGGAAPAALNSTAGGTDLAGAGVNIRGLRSNAGAGGTDTSVAAATAVYVDEIYEGVGSSYDLDRVELLRGPQGTLYGRSATGGVVAIHTRDPKLDRVEGLGLVEIGDYDLQHFTAALNLPVVDDKLAVRVAGDYYHHDGYDTDRGIEYVTTKNARIKILAKPSDRLSILFGAALAYNEQGSGGRTPIYDNSGKISFKDSPVGLGKNHFYQFWADIQWDLGFATLTYIPAYRTWYQNANVVAAGPGFTLNQKLFTPKDNFLTNEVRLTSDSASKLKWQAGFLVYDNTLTNSNTVRLALPGDPLAFSAATDKKTRAFGIFGEATYPLTDAWRVTGGLRFDHTAVNVAEDYTSFTGQTLSLSAEEGRRRFSDWTFKLRTEYDLSTRNLVYASFATGFSPGDASVTTNVLGVPQALRIDDKLLKSFEVGSKNRFLDGKLQANISLYYYDYGGYQNAGIDIDPGPGLAFATLVSPQKAYGGEFETVFQPTQLDRVALNLGYVHARFVNRSAEVQMYIARGEVPQVAPFTADLSYSHRFDLPGGSSLTFVGDGRYLSAHYGDTITAQQASLGAAALVRVDDVAIANASLTWTSAGGKFSLGGYVRNIGDKRYLTVSDPDTTMGFLNGGTGQIYQPRTFGGIATINF